MKRRPTPALVISLVALFVALGGTAYASGLISGRQIVNHSIPAKKLTKSAIKSLHGRRGRPGAAGQAGPQGPRGSQGPAGESASYQNLETTNRDVGADTAHAVTLTTLTVAGPGSYLLTGGGSLFPEGTAPQICDATFNLELDGTTVSFHQAGALLDASGHYLEGTYAVAQLITLPSGTHTLTIKAYDAIGSALCATFANSLVATRVGSATTEAAPVSAFGSTDGGAAPRHSSPTRGHEGWSAG